MCLSVATNLACFVMQIFKGTMTYAPRLIRRISARLRPSRLVSKSVSGRVWKEVEGL